MAIQLHEFSNRESCVQTLSGHISAALIRGLSASDSVRLLLPGGSSPEPLLPLLNSAFVAWSQVQISPTDERWVPRDSLHSNMRLLRRGLVQASFLDPRQADEPLLAAELWGHCLNDGTLLAAALLGAGEDGHFASIFAGMPNIGQALDTQAKAGAVVGQALTEPKVRLSVNSALLAKAQWLGLLIFSEQKRVLLDSILADQPETRVMPLYSLLHDPQFNNRLQVYWAP